MSYDNGSAAYSLTLLSHRQAWNGSVCGDPSAWQCGMHSYFREDKCALGEARCNDMHTFDREQPRYNLKGVHANYLVPSRGRIFDDQIVVFCSKGYGEPSGIGSTSWYVSGAYRVHHAEQKGPVWEIIPHTGSWVRFPRITVRAPSFIQITAGVPLARIRRDDLLQAFDILAKQIARGTRLEWLEEGDLERFQQFHHSIEGWLDQAAVVAERFPPAEPATKRHSFGEKPLNNPFDVLAPLSAIADSKRPAETGDAAVTAETVANYVQAEVASPKSATPATDDPVRSEGGVLADEVIEDVENQARRASENARRELPEAGKAREIGEIYGPALLRRLRAALETKYLVLLSGQPGTRKSYLARHLLDDDQPGMGDRLLIVPVGATWRGREDLLGYANPVTQEFQVTPFTNFLISAHKARLAGDLRPRVVVFEEFNLSQPEHWFSDVLVRGEYEADDDLGRTIDLCSEGGLRSVILSPYISFIGTINVDHTVRSLSPRILDRAAVVELTCTPNDALAVASASLSPPMILAIEKLNQLLASKGIQFSVRTARSIKALLDLGFAENVAVDLVFNQEVLVKLQCLAGDPRDKALLGKLQHWADEFAPGLHECHARFSQWQEKLESGSDIVQV